MGPVWFQLGAVPFATLCQTHTFISRCTHVHLSNLCPALWGPQGAMPIHGKAEIERCQFMGRWGSKDLNVIHLCEIFYVHLIILCFILKFNDFKMHCFFYIGFISNQ